MARHHRSIFAALVLSAAACHGAATSDAHPSGPLTEQRRSEILDAIDAKYTELEAVDPTSAPAGVVVFAKTFVEVEDSRSSDDGRMVWTTFTDGRIHIVGSNHDDGVATSAMQIPSPQPAPIDTGKGPHTEFLPIGAQYVVLRAMGSSWGDAPDAIDKALHDVGYTKKTLEFTPSALKAPGALQNVAVLYISTHGSASTGVSIDGGYATRAALWTSQPEDVKLSETTYKDDLDHGRMTTFSARLIAGDAHKVRHYAITPAFVSTYLELEKDLVVYADACESAAGLAGEKAFAETFFRGGAAEYLGWTKEVDWHDSDRVARLFFDGVLGQPVSNPPPDPRTRPFPIARVFFAESFTGPGGTHLEDVTPGVSKEWVDLVPSISNMAFDRDDFSHLQINGRFGFPTAGAGDAGVDAAVDLTPVTVTVGGVSANVVGVTNGAIVVKLPDDGPGSAGDVVVSVRNIHSNAVPLTDWHAKFHFSAVGVGVDAGVAGLCTYTFDWTLHLRGDIHTYSDAPHNPRGPSGLIVPAPNATMTYVISGTGTSAGRTFVCAGTGSPTFSPSLVVGAASVFNWLGQSSPAPPAFLPNLLVGGAVLHVGGTYAEPPSAPGPFDVATYTIPWPSFLVLDTDGTIKAGSSGTLGQLTWAAIPASSVPTLKTAQ